MTVQIVRFSKQRLVPLIEIHWRDCIIVGLQYWYQEYRGQDGRTTRVSENGTDTAYPFTLEDADYNERLGFWERL
jgi:hypothetical protein